MNKWNSIRIGVIFWIRMWMHITYVARHVFAEKKSSTSKIMIPQATKLCCSLHFVRTWEKTSSNNKQKKFPFYGRNSAWIRHHEKFYCFLLVKVYSIGNQFLAAENFADSDRTILPAEPITLLIWHIMFLLKEKILLVKL